MLNNDFTLNVDSTFTMYGSNSSPLADLTAIASLHQSSSMIDDSASTSAGQLSDAETFSDSTPVSLTYGTAPSTATDAVDWNSSTQDHGFSMVSYDEVTIEAPLIANASGSANSPELTSPIITSALDLDSGGIDQNSLTNVVMTVNEPNQFTASTGLDTSNPNSSDSGASIVVVGGVPPVDPISPTLPDPNSGGNSGSGSNPEDDFNRAVDQAKKTSKTTSLGPGSDVTDSNLPTNVSMAVDDPSPSTGSGDSGSSVIVAGSSDPISPISPISPDPNPNPDPGGGGSGDSPFDQIAKQIKKKMADAGSFDERYSITSQFDPVQQIFGVDADTIKTVFESTIQQAHTILPNGSDTFTPSDSGLYEGLLYQRHYDDGMSSVDLSCLYLNDLRSDYLSRVSFDYAFTFRDQSGEGFAISTTLYEAVFPGDLYGYITPFDLRGYNESFNGTYVYEQDTVTSPVSYSVFSYTYTPEAISKLSSPIVPLVG